MRRICEDVGVPHIQVTEVLRRVDHAVRLDKEVITQQVGTFYLRKRKPTTKTTNGVVRQIPARESVALRGARFPGGQLVHAAGRMWVGGGDYGDLASTTEITDWVSLDDGSTEAFVSKEWLVGISNGGWWRLRASFFVSVARQTINSPFVITVAGSVLPLGGYNNEGVAYLGVGVGLRPESYEYAQHQVPIEIEYTAERSVPSSGSHRVVSFDGYYRYKRPYVSFYLSWY